MVDVKIETTAIPTEEQLKAIRAVDHVDLSVKNNTDPLIKEKIDFVMFILAQRLWKADEFLSAEQAVDKALAAWAKVIA